MSETPTPGQIAYAAFMRASLPSLREQEAIMPWDSPLFLASERAAWEAAAQAVREATQADTCLYRYRLGQQVRWACAPEAVWRITYRASHEDRVEGLRLSYGIRHEDSRRIRMAEESELRNAEDSDA